MEGFFELFIYINSFDMKNIILYGAVAVLLSAGGLTEVQAQRKDKEDKYWEHRKEANKKRGEYDKKQAKHYREHLKKEEEYYRESSKKRKEYYKEVRKHGPPAWAKAHGYDARKHVYFRDYHTFYDPYRGGYVFLEGRNWRFSTKIPSFMVNIDLGHANIRVLGDIPIDRHPEDFYDDYDEEYWED
jgi:hypothetical protein